jgi:DNA-binding NarL/FixJ family response regulator
MRIKIVVADDHYLLRKALILLLQMREDFEVCAEASSGAEALQKIKMYRPDILLLDLQMPDVSGFEVLESIRKEKINVKTIPVSGYDTEENIVRCMELGARGFLSKDSHPEEAYEAIDSVMANGFYFKDEINLSLLKEIARLKKFRPRFGDDTIHFDEKEMKVVYFHCAQLSNEEIGEKIFASGRTVEGIKTKMAEKIDVKNFVAVVLYCHQNRLIDLDSMPLQRRSKSA